MADREIHPFLKDTEIGYSPWMVVSQSMIDQFGAATLDPDPMHVDPEWAERNSPFGESVAFGFLTVSLLTHLLRSAVEANLSGDAGSDGAYINYGLDGVRLIAPIPAGARVRGYFRCLDVRHDDRQRQIARFECRIELEGIDRPAMVGEWLALWLPPDPARSA